MANHPTAFVREGDVPYQANTIVLKPGEIRQIPGTLRYLLLKDITTESKLFVSFNGASFWNLPAFEQLQDFEADSVWLQNTDIGNNTVTVVTGMATLNATRVVVDSTTGLTVTVAGTAATSNVAIGAQADAAATNDTGAWSLIALFKRLCAKFDVLIKTTFVLDTVASNNGQLISTGAHRVYSLSMMNTGAAVKYVRLYDKAIAPVVGTDIATRVFAIPAGLSQTITFPGGDSFANGLGIAVTNAAAYNDATAVAAHDVQLTLNYV